MAYPVSLQTMLKRVRQRSNLEGASAFITDVEITDHINQSLSEWYDVVRSSTWGGQYYRSIYGFQTVASNNNTTPLQNPPPGSFYPLPADFLAMTSVDVAISASLILSCRAFQEEQRNMFRWYPVGWLFDQPIFYQIWGGNIVFIPAPQSTFQVQINYVPVAPQLFASSDTFDSINGWEEFIVLDAAIKCLIKDGQMDIIPLLSGRLEQQKQRIRANAPKRDMNQAEVVHEIAADYSDWDLF